MEEFVLINNIYYYKLSKLNKNLLNDLKVIFNVKEIKYLTLHKLKYEKIKEKHALNSGELTLYKHMHKQMVWFINKGYISKGYKVSVVEGVVNLTIDTALKLSNSEIARVRIPLMIKEKTLIIKSFYIKGNIIRK